MNPTSGAGPRVCAPDTLTELPRTKSNLAAHPFGNPGKSLELAGEEDIKSENRGQVTRLGNERPGRQLCEEDNKITVQISQLETRPILSLPSAHSLGPGSFQSPTEASLLPADLPFNNHPVAPSEHLAGRQGTRSSGSLSPKQPGPLPAVRQRPEEGAPPSVPALRHQGPPGGR